MRVPSILGRPSFHAVVGMLLTILRRYSGTSVQGDSLIDGIPETLEKLRAAGKKMFFVTNNSTKSRAGYKKKFDSLGLDVPAEEIFSSSFAAAAYLEQTKFKETGKKVGGNLGGPSLTGILHV